MLPDGCVSENRMDSTDSMFAAVAVRSCCASIGGNVAVGPGDGGLPCWLFSVPDAPPPQAATSNRITDAAMLAHRRSRFRENDELGLAKSPYISNVNTA